MKAKILHLSLTARSGWRRSALVAFALVSLLPFERAAAQRGVNLAERLTRAENIDFLAEAETRRAVRLRWLSEEMAARLNAAPRVQFPDAVTGPSTWNGGAGNWSNGAMWTPIDPPNSSGADVSIDGGNGVASAVTLDGGFTVGRLTIDLGDSLSFNNGTSLTIATGAFSGSGTLVNNGAVTINSGGSFTDLVLSGDVTFSGTGTFTLAGAGNARIRGGSRLTNAAGHTIQGQTNASGSLGNNDTAITNQGLIDANVSGLALVLDPAAVTDGFRNTGTMQASNGGILLFTGNGTGAFNNTGGTIQALAGSEVRLVNSAAISGGTLSSTGTGFISILGGNSASLADLTSTAAFTVSNGANLILAGTITNNGTILLNAANSFTGLLGNGATLAGSGTLTLQDAAFIGGGGTFTNASTIQGETINSGSIGFNNTAIINQGLIDANVAGLFLLLDPIAGTGTFSNTATGTLRASNGGLLRLTGNGTGSFTSAGTILATGAGSEVQLTTGVDVNGTFTTAAGGVVRNLDSATLRNATNAGTFIANNGTNTTLVGTLTNNGTILLNAANSFTGLLGNGATLAGSGTLTLQDAAFIGGGGTFTNASTIQGETINSGSIGFNNTAIINQGLIDANVAGLFLLLDPIAGTGTFSNTATGTLRASNGGLLRLTGNGTGSFTNAGIFEALNGSNLTMDVGAELTNNQGGVLIGGSYRAIATGNGATLTIRGPVITTIFDNASITLSGAGSIFQVDATQLEASLANIGGVLRILDNRNYTTANNLLNTGIVELGGGILTSSGLTINAPGEFFGFGTVMPRAQNSGLVRAVGGSLVLTNGVGSTGTVRIDSSGLLDLTGSTIGNAANNLIHNGNAAASLALGSQNFTVGLDYTNANFGVGNSFNPRANVTGAGLILAAGNVGQTLTGNVTGGTTANAILAFGNVHVGDNTTLNYQINNTGTSGPVLRGAIQTSVNGGNLTDGRLGGAGVTASNFGPIGLGMNSGNLAVSFNAMSAGALNGQSVHLINNFANVGDQDLSITGAAFRFANPTMHTPEPVALGNFHVGDANPMMALSLTNNVLADGFSEALNAMIGGATGGVLASGSFNQLAPGATNNTNLMVGFSTANAGSQSGTATIALQSDGTGSSGLGITNLPSQTVNVTGGVYRYAAPVLNTPVPVVFTNSHVGDVISQALSITNNVPNDGFSERLDASFTGTTGNTTGTGSFTLLGAGATNSNGLFVGLDTSAAGARFGTATIGYTSNGTGTSGLASTALPGQTINVSGNVYRYANPTLQTATPVSFGVVHVGDSVAGVALSLANNVPADGFSESLNASIGGGTNGVTASGSFTGLAPGATNNSSLTVGIDTATAGSRNGNATITQVSNGAGSSNLGLTNLPSQIVNVTGQVNFFADPVLIFQSGSATLTMNSATSFTLNFGAVMQNSGTYLGDFAVMNFLHDAIFQDALGGSWDTASVTNFILAGFGAFSGIDPGAMVDPSVTFDSNRAFGSYTDTILLNATSTNASGSSNLAPVQLNIQAQVVPEPSPIAMLVLGGAMLFAMRRFLRRNADRPSAS